MLADFLNKNKKQGFLFEKIDAYSPLQNKTLKVFLAQLKIHCEQNNIKPVFVVDGVTASVCVRSAVAAFRALGFETELPLDAVVEKDKDRDLLELASFCDQVGAKVTKTIDYLV